MKQLKVAVLTYSVKPRGGVVHATYLAESLLKKHIDVHIFSLNKINEKSKFYRPIGAPFTLFHYKPTPTLIKTVGGMIDAYVKNLPLDYNIYHAQDCIGGNALIKLKTTRELKAPHIQTIHHIDIFQETELLFLQEKAIRQCDRILTVSKFCQNLLQEKYHLKSDVIYNGVDPERFSGLKGKVKKNNILFVGGLEYRKGLEYLLLAFEKVLKNKPETVLRIIARSGLRKKEGEKFFKLLIDRLRLRKNIILERNVEEKMLTKYYKETEIVVLPSRIEGWGLSLLEGMAAGKPVIASKVGGIPEFVRDGFNGYLIEEGDINTLSNRIEYLLKHEPVARKIGLHGKETIKNFTWDKTAEKAIEIYNQALKTED